MFAFFTDPTNRPAGKKGRDTRWQGFLLDAFRCAAKETIVLGAIYRWDLEEFSEKLNEIREDRNLSLRICAGRDPDRSDTYYPIPSAVKKAFKDFDGGGIFECDPAGMMNHNKFFVFEKFKFDKFSEMHQALGEIPENSPALYISSSNISHNDNNKHNTFVIVPINAAIKKAFGEYYEDLNREYLIAATCRYGTVRSPSSSRNRYRKVSSDRVKVYFFPRTTGIDTIEGVVDNIRAVPTTDSRAVVNPSSEIRIVVPRWFNRRVGIAYGLKKLAGKGVDCRVITRCKKKHLGKKVKTALEGIREHRFQNTGKGVNIHSKYILIDAPYKDGDSYTMQKLIWVGSANLSPAAIDRHWEVIIKIKNEEQMFEAFKKNYQNLAETEATVSRFSQ